MAQEGPGARVVVVADDDAHTCFLLRELFESWGFKVLLAEGGLRALELIDESTTLLVLDLMMPGVDGFEVLRRLRASPALAGLPVIIVTALGDVDGKLRGIELGADDYVTKPFRILDLQQRVRLVLDRRRIFELGQQPPLARLPPPALAEAPIAGPFARLRESIEQQVIEAKRQGACLSALFISVETVGLTFKDPDRAALEQVALQLMQLMTRAFRKIDLVHRMDPETFLVLMPETSWGAAACVAERLLRTFEESASPRRKALVSAGIAEYPQHGDGMPEDFIRAAHQALQTAKRSGGGRVEVARSG